MKQPWEIDFPSFNFDSELSQLHEKQRGLVCGLSRLFPKKF